MGGTMTMPSRVIIICCALILASGVLAGQELQITPNNRTIYVTAEDEVTLEPDIALINFGYQTFGTDQQAAMNDLSQKSKQITKALVDAAINPKAIETSALDVGRTTYFDPQTPPEVRKQRDFTARENWRVRVKAADASLVTGIARSGGANTFQGVSWELADPNQSYAKANAAALRRARAIAEQMANDMGAKLGKIIYLSNSNPVLAPMARGGNERVAKAMVASGTASPAELQFEVSRPLIHRSATVYAVFAIE
jgi:uncharacterized protein YggE